MGTVTKEHTYSLIRKVLYCIRSCYLLNALVLILSELN